MLWKIWKGGRSLVRETGFYEGEGPYQRMITEVALGAGQRVTSVILDIALLALHRVVGVMHLVHLLRIAVRVGLLMLLRLLLLLLLLLDLLVGQLLMQRGQTLVMLVHWCVGKVVRRRARGGHMLTILLGRLL